MFLSRSSKPPRTQTSKPALEALEDRVLMSANSERFVARIYRDLLGRAVDSSGRSFWSSRIDQGTSPTNVVSQIAASDEYRNAFVDGLYKNLLNRSGDSTGETSVRGLLSNGRSFSQVEALFLGSPEYLQHRTDNSTTSFLNAVYQDVLGRAVEPQGQAFWSGVLGQGVSRSDVAAGILASGEASEAQVRGIYQQFLHRDPDAGGASHWVSLLKQGTPNTSVLAAIAGSDEYRNSSAAQDDFTPVSPSNVMMSDPDGGTLTGPSSQSAQTIVMSFLQDHQADMSLSDADLRDMKVTDQYTDADTGATHIYMMQAVGGIGMPMDRLNATLDNQGRIVTLAQNLVPHASERVNETSPTLGPIDGMLHVMDQMGMQRPATVTIVSQDGTPDQSMTLSVGGLTVSGNATTHLVYMPMADGSLHLSWQVHMQMAANTDMWELGVDAETGQLLQRNNWTDAATYKAFAYPTRNPDQSSASLVNDQVNNASPFGWHNNTNRSGNDSNQTRGNNVIAGTDRNAGGFTTSTAQANGSNNTFDYSADFLNDPVGYQNAATVNLFYWCNLAHDTFFNYGFTEAAGNFQTLNYTSQGQGTDPVLALAQFGANTLTPNNFNNAFFSSPPDGQSGAMHICTFTATDPMRDADFDSQIIVHEYGHGVTNRLTGGPANASALQLLQSAGMGEGWSDFFALALTARPGDKGTDRQVIAAWDKGQTANGAGIRSMPYSTSLLLDWHMYSDIRLSVEPHFVGETWCSVLWDLYWNLVARDGMSANNAPGNTGNAEAMKLVMDGLKIQPANPTFLQARDAILAADRMDFAGRNQDLIWSTFARRGMGVNASDGGSASTNFVTNGFNTPPVATGGTIRGNVFRDSNANGRQDSGEAVIANQGVYLDLNNNGTLDPQLKSFSSGTINKPITDFNTTTSTILVSGLFGKVNSITVTLNIHHTFDQDLTAQLVSPTGQTVNLLNRNGSSGHNFLTTTFDDAAPTPITSGSAPFTSVFRPASSLAAVKGIAPGGTWTLRVTDNAGGDVGTLDSWQMSIGTDTFDPVAFTDGSGSYSFGNRALGTYVVRANVANSQVTTPSSNAGSATLTSSSTTATVNFGLR